MLRRAVLALSVLAAVGSNVPRALGNGAFPDSSGVIAPAGEPNEIFLATNFGLLVSDDSGTSWQWICEQAIVSYAFLFASGPPPARRLFAVGSDGFVGSSDVGCSWSRASFGATAVQVTDVFPDPVDPMHVLAIGVPAIPNASYRLLESRDGGLTFATELFAGPSGASLNSVEIARSDPRTVYLTMSSGEPKRWILRSTNGGESFETIDHTAELGSRTARIALVDPEDPRKLYLRVVDSGGVIGDALAISRDGGDSLEISPPFRPRMTAFLKRPTGALIVATSTRAFVSRDDGASFDPMPGAPRIRGLAERDGAIYAAADDVFDGFAIAVSRDDGATWDPLLRFKHIRGIRQCGEVPATCAGPWSDLMSTFGIDAPPPDAGTSSAADAGVAADASSETDAGGDPPSDGVCACTNASRPAPAIRSWIALGALALVLGVRRRTLRCRGG